MGYRRYRGEDETAVAEAASQVVRLANARGAEGFVARSRPETGTRSGSTARAPPPSPATPTPSRSTRMCHSARQAGRILEGIERINIELSIGNKVAPQHALSEFFAGSMPPPPPMPRRVRSRAAGDKLAEEARSRRHGAGALVRALERIESTFPRPARSRKRSCHGRRNCWTRWRRSSPGVRSCRAGAGARDPSAKCCEARVRRAAHARRRWQRPHQYPGHSDDYDMLRVAGIAVARIMRLAESLVG